MKETELVDLICKRITGGEVALDIPTAVIMPFISQAILEVRAWYSEAETRGTFDLTDIHIRMVDLSHADPPCRQVKGILPTNALNRIHRLDDPFYLTRASKNVDLLSTEGIELITLEMMTDRAVRSMNQPKNYFYDENKKHLLLDSSYPFSNVTVIYIPEVNKLDDIRKERALQLVIDLSLAYTKEAVARVRGKFAQSGTVDMEVDYSAMLQEAQTTLSSKMELLKDLDF